MANPYYNRLHIDFEFDMETYSPDTDEVINTEASDKINTYESSKVNSPYSHTVQLLKDDADVEVVPGSLSGIRFVLIRVKTENLVDVPADGQVTAKITSSAGLEQAIKGDLIIVRDKNAEITSIKLTNEENNATGVSLPVLVFLGGINV